MTSYYLGIDTSAYTTSLGLIDHEDNILVNLKTSLIIDKDKIGLRQQEAIFQHLNNFPLLIEKLTKKIDVKKINTISVSSRPRNLLESYMPVFILGRNQGFILSQVLKVPYKQFSHQEGHIAAALISNLDFACKEYLALHISGGTSELLLVQNEKDNFNISLIGGNLDISFGQLIDRIGVYLGYKFPCGQKLDILSQGASLIQLNIPINIKKNYWTSISGLENYFKKLIDDSNYPIKDIIFTLFHTIALFVMRFILISNKEHKLSYVLVTGGVSANTYIRKYLSFNLPKHGITPIFPKEELSTDNGVGVSYLGKIKKGHNEEVEK